MANSIRSFSTEQPWHPALASYLLGRDAGPIISRNMGHSIKAADVGPTADCLLGRSLFLGSLNSRTGFCSNKNNFSIMCPVVLFAGKQTFTCEIINYPTCMAGPVTARSDGRALPAMRAKTTVAADMIGLKVELEPETNLICDPRARYEEYMRRTIQCEKSFSQTMQLQICSGLSKCPSMSMMRAREQKSRIDSLMHNPKQLKTLLYSWINQEKSEWCHWTLLGVKYEAALEEAFLSLLSDSEKGQEPNYVVTTPEIADFIASGAKKIISGDAMYTVAYPEEKGDSGVPPDVFSTSMLVPYKGVSKEIVCEVSTTRVMNKELPVLQVPHLACLGKGTDNPFEKKESFWVFNEIGYFSGQRNATVEDFRAGNRTAINVTDLHLGRDGIFTMDQCLKQGGGLLPATYDRLQYDEMLLANPGLKNFLTNRTNSTDLLGCIGKPLPLSSPYVLYFPSPKVRFKPGQPAGAIGASNFRSTGIFGNRASFPNFHPVEGDLEAAKDFLARKFNLKSTELDMLFSYLVRCGELDFTQRDIEAFLAIDKKFPTVQALKKAALTDEDVNHFLRDISKNRGLFKLAGVPRFMEGFSHLCNLAMQEKTVKKGEDDTDALQLLVRAREELKRIAIRYAGIVSRVDAPDGLMTDCPGSVPLGDFHLNQPAPDSWDHEQKAMYKTLTLVFNPLCFSKLINVVCDKENKVPFVTYRLPGFTNRPNYNAAEETFQQPYFARAIPTNRDISSFKAAAEAYQRTAKAGTTIKVVDVTAYDPLYEFDIDVLRQAKHSRDENFFDHFVSHRYDCLRKTTDEPPMVRATAALLCMFKYTPTIERVLGHDCLMNRKYRIFRQCCITVGMVGLYAGGHENMIYACGNLSTQVTPTANNTIDIMHRMFGNPFIMDPMSCGRTLPNAVSKGLEWGMTSVMEDMTAHLGDSRDFRLPQHWYRNSAFVVEGLPGMHPIRNQDEFIPGNGRHISENYNSAGFDLCQLDKIGQVFTENPYATKYYSEAHLVFGKLFRKNHVPLYDREPAGNGLENLVVRGNKERELMAGTVVMKTTTPPSAVFSDRSNICFLERQENLGDKEDAWTSKSPLKENSNSTPQFAQALRLNCRRADTGFRNVHDGRLQKTGLKGLYAARAI